MKTQKLDQSHLTLEQRIIIQTGIENRGTKAAIAKTIGKDSTTVAKEIKKHREFRSRNTFNHPTDCIYAKKCGKCFKQCDKYEKPKCKFRDRSPGACNKCLKTKNCHLDKYFYNARNADDIYRSDLVEFREGINLTIVEKNELASILKPLLDKKQSIYQILVNHPEIKQSEKTIYNYINQEVFKDNGIDFFSLKEKIQRKPSKVKYKKRKEPVNYTNRKYSDFLDFMAENPDANIIEMDTVYNHPSGPYIQTLKFKKEIIQIGFVHEKKDSTSMASTLDLLEEKLGHNFFCENLPVFLTDRGSEFEKWNLFEANTETGEYRCNIYYCDPMQSSQKPNCENNHNYIRDIIPNESDLSDLTQDDLNLIFSHINSVPRKSLNDKTPYEMAEFIQSKDFLDKLNIQKIEKDQVTLSPDLLKK